MRHPILALLIAVLIASPARADITARYVDQNGTPLIVEVDDSGDSRVQVNDASYVKRDGVGYLVATDRSGVFVVRTEDFAAVLEGLIAVTTPEASAGAGEVGIRDVGAEQVAGQSGRLFHVGRGDDVIEAVLSGDPALAPLAGALQFHFRPMIKAAMANRSDVGEAIMALFERGALLRLGLPGQSDLLTLEAIERHAIPADRFALPSEPISREQLVERMGVPSPGE